MSPAMGMSETSTEEYTKKMRARYGRLTGRKARGKVLDEFVEITGWDRKHANRPRPPTPRPLRRLNPYR